MKAILHGKVRREFSGIVGAGIMFFFAVAALGRWFSSRELFFLLLAFRDVLAATYLLKRRTSQYGRGGKEAFIAYASSALPFFYSTWDTEVSLTAGLVAQLLVITGFLLATLATIELGDLMGVSPAFRGARRSTGVYRIIRHPMYLGYAIAEFGWVVLSPMNAALYSISVFGYWKRSKLEDRLFVNNAMTGDRDFSRSS